MGELVTIGTGSRNTNEAVPDGHFPFYVRSQAPLAIDEAEFDEVAIVTAGDGVGVGKVFHFVEGPYALHQRAYRLRVESPLLIPKFLFHYIRHDFARYLSTTAVHASVTSLRKPMFENYPVPILPLEDQRRIAAVLDDLESAVVELSSELTAEMAARDLQYRYHRDRLLAFKVAA
jgi:type I restriction enzyme, S subunit